MSYTCRGSLVFTPPIFLNGFGLQANPIWAAGWFVGVHQLEMGVQPGVQPPAGNGCSTGCSTTSFKWVFSPQEPGQPLACIWRVAEFIKRMDCIKRTIWNCWQWRSRQWYVFYSSSRRCAGCGSTPLVLHVHSINVTQHRAISLLCQANNE